MKITESWLKEKSACSEGVKWFLERTPREGTDVIRLLMKEDRFQWANWLICRLMDKSNCVRYAIFAALEVIKIFEKKYPEDKRPRKAIEAAQAWLDNPNDKTKAAAADAAAAAAAAADAAAYAAYADAAAAAAAVADAAAYAAYADAAAAAAAAADAAAADAAYADAAYAAAAYAAAYAADDARKKLQLKILEYGLKLLEKL